jgi:hypothetical protein
LKYLAGSLALFALALGSYEAAVVLPLVVVLYEILLGEGGIRRREAPGDRAGTTGAAGDTAGGAAGDVAVDRPRGGWLTGVTAGAGGWLPLFALAALYLLVRRAVFGVVVGGYEDLGRRLLEARPAALAGDLAASIYRLFAPLYARPPGVLGPVALLALLAAAPVAWHLATRRRLGGGHLRLWLFGWGWTLAWLAPFAFRPAVPGNGRYGYLASIGAALIAVALARWLAAGLALAARPQARAVTVRALARKMGIPGRELASKLKSIGLPVEDDDDPIDPDRIEAILQPAAHRGGEARPRRPSWPVALPAAAVAALAVFWTVLLTGYLATYRQAGRTARAVQTALATAAAAAHPGDRLFVTGHPAFIENAAGVPLAQVLRYGLADSVRPPFGEARVPVYPLPPLTAAELAPLAAMPARSPGPATAPMPATPETAPAPLAGGRNRFLAWDAGAARLREILPAPPGGGDAGAPLELTVESATADEVRVAAAPPASGAGLRYRLIVVAEGNSAIVDLGAPQRGLTAAGGSAAGPQRGLTAAGGSAADPQRGLTAAGGCAADVALAGGAVRAPLPAAFIQTMDRLYGGERFWWIEARDAEGRLAAFTRARSLPGP